MAAAIALLAVGGIEAALGALFVLLPSIALPLILGRTLAVGSSLASLSHLTAQAGMLRLSVGAILLAVGLCGSAGSMSAQSVRVIAAVGVAYCGLLKPYSLLFRSHHRMPISWQLTLALIEGAALTLTIAMDADFDSTKLVHQLSFVLAAVIMICSLLLTAVGGIKGRGPKNPSDPELAIDTPDLASGLLFDDTRHTLSPASRRLLQ